MDIETEIKHCQESMSQLWRIVQGLQESGLDPKDPLFDDLADKTWKHMFRWECLAQLEHENKFQTYFLLQNELSVPEGIFKEFTGTLFVGLNPNDHFHLQN